MIEVAIKAEEFCFLWIPHWSTCMTKSEWASWAQAIGTIAALIAAVGAVWWEVRQRRGDAKSDTAEALLARIAVLRLVAGEMERYIQANENAAVGTPAALPIYLAGFQNALAEADRVPLLDMPTAKCVEHLVQIRAAILGSTKMLNKVGAKRLSEDELFQMRSGYTGLMRNLQGLWDEAHRIAG